jgi:hypothetical protein
MAGACWTRSSSLRASTMNSATSTRGVRRAGQSGAADVPGPAVPVGPTSRTLPRTTTSGTAPTCDDVTVELLASGRDADVFLLDPDRVLRRYRDGRPALREAETIRAVAAEGLPAPTVHATSGPDIVMGRVDGPTLGASLLEGTTPPDEAGGTLAGLHSALHAIEIAGGTPLHMDLHPLNVMQEVASIDDAVTLAASR